MCRLSRVDSAVSSVDTDGTVHRSVYEQVLRIICRLFAYLATFATQIAHRNCRRHDRLISPHRQLSILCGLLSLVERLVVVDLVCRPTSAASTATLTSSATVPKQSYAERFVNTVGLVGRPTLYGRGEVPVPEGRAKDANGW